MQAPQPLRSESPTRGVSYELDLQAGSSSKASLFSGASTPGGPEALRVGALKQQVDRFDEMGGRAQAWVVFDECVLTRETLVRRAAAATVPRRAAVDGRSALRCCRLCRPC